jgi:rhodanese-related sulfurtransferase/DNA-binding transcriptional ArsR family regulator
MGNNRRFKDQVYDQFERIGKALASRRRLELLEVLAQGDRPVEELASETAMTVANASQHLQVLRRARLVETRQEGKHVFYSLADDRVFTLLQALRGVAETRLAEIEQITRDFLGDRDGLDPVRMGELFDRLRTGDVIVLDVRPPEEYESGHIAGARSMPLDELEARLAELPSDADVVAYCRGPYCVLAVEAVERLRQRGRPARRLDLGFPDWQAAGLPVETGASRK